MKNKEASLKNFIEKSIKKHGDKYSYDNVLFIDCKKKVKIICKEHGEFEQRPDSHIYGNGCKKCAIEKNKINKSSNTLDFIKKAKKIHNNTYDYSLVDYIRCDSKIKIICKEHGIFEQTPNCHLRGYKCPNCFKITTEEFVKKSEKIHKKKYIYEKTKYSGSEKKVTIKCPKHGFFEQAANNHLSGKGCGKCAGKNMTNEEIIEKFKKIHGNKYDYSLFEYVNSNSKIKITCKNHGVFEQTPHNHLSGKGCQVCGGRKIITKEELIKEFNKKHNNFYDYNLVEFINFHSPIKIICRIHGEFKQSPNNHKKGQGCPSCSESKGEKEIRNFLIKNSILFYPQHKFSDCKNIKELPFDFYIEKHKICIEYNGKQHYEPIEYFGGQENFLKTKKRDKIKKDYCKNNNIKLFIIKYNENINKKLESIFKTKL